MALKTAKPKVIAIDGTFASGKGTLAKRLAAHYGLSYLDTGKLYRATAKLVIDAKGDPDSAVDAEKAARALNEMDIDSFLSDPTLKSGGIGAAASKVAVHPVVRQALFQLQRDFAKQGAVLDGRDIGTVICPDADVKLYVDAKAEIRAARRHAELVGYGEDISFKTVLAQLKERDSRDMGRKDAPLKPAEDAHFLDSSDLSVEDAFDRACQIIEAVIQRQSQ
ncbi:cytidylate kinase [Litorimonas taeanensis]|uniref:Cytidylate kinase n=1 Tax=Litorimonas taeanensis TaxID=568099 RepID=A0A420WF96_9PROT|nr:(d)CMP kinase [Litorimonas taeanensis]RKQ69635.1 cytidylate kinase [Litorimonas taeanensis]